MMETTHEAYPDPHHDIYSRTVFGFWIYLLTDFVMFATFFATYAVLRTSTYSGPIDHDLFDFTNAFYQTLILLTSSLTVGLAGAYAHRKNKKWTIILFLLTFLLGLAFTVQQFAEYKHLLNQGLSWRSSAFLSAYFTLLGTHTAHMLFALLWTIILIIPIFREEITNVTIRRLTCLRMFWQFLNIVWVFIFTFVYFMGEISA